MENHTLTENQHLLSKLTWEKLGTLTVLRIDNGWPWFCSSSLMATFCRRRSNVKMLSTAETPRVYFSIIYHY